MSDTTPPRRRAGIGTGILLTIGVLIVLPAISDACTERACRDGYDYADNGAQVPCDVLYGGQ